MMTIVGDKEINWNGKVDTLNKITLEILRNEFGIKKRYVKESEFWMYGSPKNDLEGGNRCCH